MLEAVGHISFVCLFFCLFLCVLKAEIRSYDSFLLKGVQRKSNTHRKEEIQHLAVVSSPVYCLFFENLTFIGAIVSTAYWGKHFDIFFSNIQIHFFFSFFPGCAIELAALGKAGLINVLPAKPLYFSPPLTQNCSSVTNGSNFNVFVPVIFSLHAVHQLLLSQTAQTWLSLCPRALLSPACCVPFWCFPTLSA